VNKEPALIIGAIQSLLVLFISFGLDLSTEQQGAILGVSSIIVALMTRSLVWSQDSVEQMSKKSEPAQH
jgi:branched-subunit amino acid transport protein